MALCPSCGTDAGEVARFCPSCGAAIARGGGTSADPIIGRIIAGKFRIDSLLGEGGMGMVYKATQINLDKVVVLKVLRPSLMSDERIVARFQREARAASRLNHPNSIAVIDFGRAADDGSMYIAMEYCPGHDLHYVISREWPLDEARIVHIATQVLSALAEAHAHGVIHRDLKPENIMVEPRRDEGEFVKVLDFGIAKIQDSAGEGEQALTRQGFVCGTPEYMSPEQAKGAAVDHRSDLYAVGVILYQMVTGLLPFDSESAVGFATAHLTQEVPAIRKRRPAARCSPQLERIIMRALAKDPKDRPQSAENFRAELLGLIPGGTSDDMQTSVGGPVIPLTHALPKANPGPNPWGDTTPASLSEATPASAPLPTPSEVQSHGPAPEQAPAHSKAPRIAVAVASVLLLGAGGFYAYEQRVDAHPVAVEDPHPAPRHGASSTGAAVAMAEAVDAGPELPLTAMALDAEFREGTAMPNPNTARARALLDQSNALVMKGNPEGAFRLLRQANQMDTGNAEVVKRAGDALLLFNKPAANYWYTKYKNMPNARADVAEKNFRLLRGN